MRLPFLLAFGAALPAAQAQPSSQNPLVPASPWNVGLKLGTGASHSSLDYSGTHPWTAFTGGFSAGYGFRAAGGFLTLQADALLERRSARPWQTATASNAVLFVPFYVRTDRAAARVHFLLGGGPTIWLSGHAVPESQTGFYTTHPVEATGLVGLEVRLLPLRRYETTVALTYRQSLTPALIQYRSSSGGHSYENIDIHAWLGATLNVHLHPAGQP